MIENVDLDAIRADTQANALPTNIDVVDTEIAATASFDYGTVDAGVVDDLRGRATKIRGLIAKSMDTIILTGRELILAKAQTCRFGAIPQELGASQRR